MNFKEIHVHVLVLAKFSFSQKNDRFLNEINALIKWAILLPRREKMLIANSWSLMSQNTQ